MLQRHEKVFWYQRMSPCHSVETFFFNMSFSMMASCWAPYPLRLRVKHKQKMHRHMTWGDFTQTRRFLKIKERISEKMNLSFNSHLVNLIDQHIVSQGYCRPISMIFISLESSQRDELNNDYVTKLYKRQSKINRCWTFIMSLISF